MIVPYRRGGMYYVYIVKCVDTTYYTGIAKDVERRLKEHNSSTKGAKYTKARRPVELVYQEFCEDRSSASKREYAIKRLNRQEKEKLVLQYRSSR
jgi:putative endonuclease